jgi:hypothetical protein
VRGKDEEKLALREKVVIMRAALEAHEADYDDSEPNLGASVR